MVLLFPLLNRLGSAGRPQTAFVAAKLPHITPQWAFLEKPQLPRGPGFCRVSPGGLSVSSTHHSSKSASLETPGQEDRPPPHLQRLQCNFCRMCGSKMELIKLPSQGALASEWRHSCTSPHCGYIDYHNPRMVVGCIVEHQGKILLARRAIEPCKGLWTVPAGYMELAETTAQGAARETLEEAGAIVHMLTPYCHWDIPVIGQTYILFRGQLAAPFHHAPGPESLETALFAPEDIPFDQIAFSSVALSLRYYVEDKASGQWRIHHGVINKQPGASPNDPATFAVAELLQLPVQTAS